MERDNPYRRNRLENDSQRGQRVALRLPHSLLRRFDEWAAAQGYRSRQAALVGVLAKEVKKS